LLFPLFTVRPLNVCVPAAAGDAIVAINVGEENVDPEVQYNLKFTRSDAKYVPVVTNEIAVIVPGLLLLVIEKLCIGTWVEPLQTFEAPTGLLPTTRDAKLFCCIEPKQNSRQKMIGNDTRDFENEIKKAASFDKRPVALSGKEALVKTVTLPGRFFTGCERQNLLIRGE
jgi:hypothetical protein